jgi:hypothetical protein
MAMIEAMDTVINGTDVVEVPVEVRGSDSEKLERRRLAT